MKDGETMVRKVTIEISYPEIGICGLSCRLCPMYHTDGISKCKGCKSQNRIAVGCPFITCAVKKKGVEFCWDCNDSGQCEKWKKHRDFSRKVDSFKCYQKLEDDIGFILANGIEDFEKEQLYREQLLTEMLNEFNEGRSKSYYCIAATVLKIDELQEALKQAKEGSTGLTIKEKFKLLHSNIDEIAKKNYYIKLRK
ncbi:DUF3795 domain-containing protein [Phosphitispora fastidiosa]|uniref:DUF3795 domain-containing protein n=1 Tax=Phosphitispora fastidiosa TaxID=2837202 RepID=UPI001E5BC1A6|nr:DUF3795 domain-containing protein [Phosphitispora fastidiosa]MBU7008656.1 hypothetical protein [Phosphitispora fastidiosa]